MKKNDLNQDFYAAEGIRGLACFIVLIAHGFSMFFLAWAPYLAGSGKIGVDLFFVLSAFLLTRKLMLAGLNRVTLMHYSIGRFLRIMPLYFMALLLYKWAGTTGISSWKDVEDAFFLNKGFSHLWTIPVEFKFYLYLPFLVFLFTRAYDKTSWLPLLLFIMLVGMEQFFWPYWKTPINSIQVTDYLTPFTTGVFCATYYDDWKRYVDFTKATAIGFCVLSIMILALPGMKKFLWGIPLDLSLANQFVYFGLVWGVFILFTIDGQGIFGKILKNSFFSRLGRWSYSMYLFHWYIFMSYIKYWPNQLLSMTAAIISAIVVGALVYYLLERRFEQFRRFLLYSLEYKWRTPMLRESTP